MGSAEGQDRGAAAQRLSDRLAVAVGDGALGDGLLDRPAYALAVAGHLRGGSYVHAGGHRSRLPDQAENQCLGRGWPEPGPGDQRDLSSTRLFVAIEQVPHGRPFVALRSQAW
jgi:hypothetical protein